MSNDKTILNIVCGAVIRKDEKYLLVQEKKPSAYGLWNIPAGHVDANESLENTAIREVKEETGFDIKILAKLKAYKENTGVKASPEKHVFEGEIISGKLRYPKDELLDAKWFTLKEINKLRDKLRNAWVLDAISMVEKKNLANKKTP